MGKISKERGKKLSEVLFKITRKKNKEDKKKANK